MLGNRFRVYSLVILLIVVVSGTMTAPYAGIAAGEPTPGFGIIERIAIYAILAWVAGLAIMLLRRRDTAT